jgi:predicted nucleic acid-binding protein
MRIAVKDASILIDLAEGDLLGLWFQLKIETHTTDLVLREVKQETQWRRISPFVDAGLLQVHGTAATEISAVVAFSQAHGISLPDASGVFLARRLSAFLLTGDRRLRRTAEVEEIEAHGLLWILDQMVERSTLPHAEAAQRLEKLQTGGSRLPAADCESRLRAWRV